jgi:hypothetical protein
MKSVAEKKLISRFGIPKIEGITRGKFDIKNKC